MGTLIPFFRYDILARMIPGALTLAVLAFVGVELPQEWAKLGSTIPGSAVIAPLVCASVCYAIGVLYEVAFAMWPLGYIAEWLAKTAFAKAKTHKLKDGMPREKETSGQAQHAEQYELWNALVHGDARPGDTFAHAHRFQAESKMCLHSVIPTGVFFVFALYDALLPVNSGRWQARWHVGLATAVLILLVVGAYAREWRRWLQVLITEPFLDRTDTDQDDRPRDGDVGGVSLSSADTGDVEVTG